MDVMLSTREVARRLGVSRPTVKRWVKERGLPCVRFTGRCLRISESALTRWVDSHADTAT